MATDFYYEVQQIYFDYSRAQASNNLAYDRLQNAHTAWSAENYPSAIYHLISAALDLQEAQLDLIDPNASGFIKYRLVKALSLCWEYTMEKPPAAEIDMSAILKAMSEAEPHQPLLFMGYLEAYKASVWNASFDETFFADLVKKWMIWG